MDYLNMIVYCQLKTIGQNETKKFYYYTFS